jgi:uncharacterized membrane protein YgcG
MATSMATRWRVAVLCGALALASSGCKRSSQPALLEHTKPASNTTSKQDGSGAVFPYSVVKGGTQTREKMEAAIRADPVVEAHYQGLHHDTMRPVHLTKDTKAYVSYRIRDKIYWTSRMVTLRKDELVLTDGRLMLRGRCGNRISETPMSPVAPPAIEPAEAAFDTPEQSLAELQGAPARTEDVTWPKPLADAAARALEKNVSFDQAYAHPGGMPGGGAWNGGIIGGGGSGGGGGGGSPGSPIAPTDPHEGTGIIPITPITPPEHAYPPGTIVVPPPIMWPGLPPDTIGFPVTIKPNPPTESYPTPPGTPVTPPEYPHPPVIPPGQNPPPPDGPPTLPPDSPQPPGNPPPHDKPPPPDGPPPDGPPPFDNPPPPPETSTPEPTTLVFSVIGFALLGLSGFLGARLRRKKPD